MAQRSEVSAESQVLTSDGHGVAIRLMRDEPQEYLQLVEWRNSPHVREWWDPDEPPVGYEGAIDKYMPRTDPAHRTTACFIEVDGAPIGYTQFYPWEAYRVEAQEIGFDPGTGWWGVDILIGEENRIGQGLGTRAVVSLCRYLHEERGASVVALTVDQENVRAVRAYERAGFERRKEVLDTDTRQGQRARCWLMVWSPAQQ